MSADLKANILPTTHNPLKYYLEESLKKKPRGLLSGMVDDVMQAWETSSLLTPSKPRVTELMRKRLDQYFDLKKNLYRKESENFKKNWQNFMKVLGHYLIYRLANAQILQLVLVQERKRYMSRYNNFYLIRGLSIDKRATSRNEKTLQRKMEDKSRSTTKSFLSSILGILNHLYHQNQVKIPIVILKIASHENLSSRHQFQNSRQNLYQTLLPPVIELVYLAERQQ